MKSKKNIRKYMINNGSESKSVNKELEDDFIVKSMGEFGAWHALVCLPVSLTRIIAMWNILSILFLTPNTEFVCIKFNDNITRDVQNSTCYKNCEQYSYYEEIFERNLITEFDLVCNRAWLASFTQTVMVFGFFIGIIVLGWFSDKFGRKKALVLSTLICVIFMFIIPFSTNYWIFTSLRFVIGFASGGILSISIVYAIETVGPKYREAITNATLVPDNLSQLLASLFAYLASTWNQYLLAYGVVSLLILLFLIWLPESPRWLIVNGRGEDAVNIMTNAATRNNRSTIGIKDNVMRAIEDLRVKQGNTPTCTYFHLFRNKQLIRTTIGAAVVWFSSGFCFYGIMQFVSLLGFNLYLVVIIMNISMLPTVFVTFVATKVIGRKIPALTTNAIIAVTMIILIFVPDDTIYSTVLGIFGTAVANISFSIMYLYTPELYPTTIRNMGLSFNSSASKFGAMIAPFIANTKPHWIASLIFAMVSFVAASCCLLIPETKGKKMQDTFDE